MGSHLVSLRSLGGEYGTWLITSELANQQARKVLFTCVVYTKKYIKWFEQRLQEAEARNQELTESVTHGM